MLAPYKTTSNVSIKQKVLVKKTNTAAVINLLSHLCYFGHALNRKYYSLRLLIKNNTNCSSEHQSSLNAFCEVKPSPNLILNAFVFLPAEN